MRRLPLAAGAVALALAAGGVWYATRPKPAQVGDPPPPAEPQTGPTIFEDVTAGSGVVSVYRNAEEINRFSILESLGGACL